MRLFSPTVQLVSCVREHHQGKEVNTMNYETPELTPLTHPINAIQSSSKPLTNGIDSEYEVLTHAYADWEE